MKTILLEQQANPHYNSHPNAVSKTLNRSNVPQFVYVVTQLVNSTAPAVGSELTRSEADRYCNSKSWKVTIKGKSSWAIGKQTVTYWYTTNSVLVCRKSPMCTAWMVLHIYAAFRTLRILLALSVFEYARVSQQQVKRDNDMPYHIKGLKTFTWAFTCCIVG